MKRVLTGLLILLASISVVAIAAFAAHHYLSFPLDWKVICLILVAVSILYLLLWLGSWLLFVASNGSKQITMSAETEEVTINICGVGRITIDWGDGTSSSLKYFYMPFFADTHKYRFSHSYNDETSTDSKRSYTITIEGRYINSLDASNNKLTDLDVSNIPELTVLDCSENELKSVDVSHNKALKELDCSNNRLESLNVTKNRRLRYLLCDENEITSLNTSKNGSLKRLDCSNNQLTGLDLTKNSSLTELLCMSNPIETLNVNKNVILRLLMCFDTLLTRLDVSKNSKLTDLIFVE